MGLGFALQARGLEAVASSVDANSCVVPVPGHIDAGRYLDHKYPAV